MRELRRTTGGRKRLWAVSRERTRRSAEQTQHQPGRARRRSGRRRHSRSWAQTRAHRTAHHSRPSSCIRTAPSPRVRAGPTSRARPRWRGENPSYRRNIPRRPLGVKFSDRRRSGHPYHRGATCPVYRRPPALPSSDLRKLTGLNQVDQHIPSVLGENREIASFPDPDLIAGEFYFRAQATSGRAQ